MRTSIDSHIFETYVLPYPRPELLKIRRISSCRVPCNAYSPSSNFVRSRPVESKTEQRFVLPRLSSHIVPASQLIGKTVSVCVETRLPTP